MKKTIKILDSIFSFFVLVIILLLVAYMVVRITAGTHIFIAQVLSGQAFLESGMHESSRRALQSIAETVILIKAYRILVSYLKSHHISVEYVVEISIIAPAIELLFAYDMYDIPSRIIIGIFGLVNLVAYLHYFGPHHDEELHKVVQRSK